MAHITFSEGSGLQDSVFGKSQTPIRRFLEKRAEAFEAKSICKEIFDTNPSTQFAEMLGGMTAMGDFQAVGENGAYPVTGFQESYRKNLVHATWKQSFSISREIMDDKKLLDLRRQPEAFIQAYGRTRERYGAALLGEALCDARSVATSGVLKSVKFSGMEHSVLGADGERLFSKAHPMKVKGGTQTNAYAGEFSEANLGKAETAMQNFCDDDGNILALAPDTIVIPNDYALKKTVFAVLGADKTTIGTTEADANGANYQFGRWNVIVWPYLNQYIARSSSTNTPWILFDSNYNKEVGTAVWFDRVALEVRSTVDENTDANVWRGYSRFVAGFNDWRGMIAGGVYQGTAFPS